MTQYLIAFDDGDMNHIPGEELTAVGAAASAVCRAAGEAGIWVFGGGLEHHETVSVVATDGTVTDGPYPESKEHLGGLTVVEVPSHEEALRWTAKIAAACRCPQQVFEVGPRPSDGGAGPPAEQTEYLIAFNDGDMNHIPDEDWSEVAEASQAVCMEGAAAGVWVFSNGLEHHETVSVVATDGTVTDGPYPESKEHLGGFVVVDVPAREQALEWAGKIAAACRCPQQFFELLPTRIPEQLGVARSARTAQQRA